MVTDEPMFPRYFLTAQGRLKRGQNISQSHDSVAKYISALGLLQQYAVLKSLGIPPVKPR